MKDEKSYIMVQPYIMVSKVLVFQPLLSTISPSTVVPVMHPFDPIFLLLLDNILLHALRFLFHVRWKEAVLLYVSKA